ncbi:MAG TPA: DUF2381 family protein [Myxococcaceae bacterium]|nr:DUF2381 family protein [Myxococcaceae bacterium]
MLLLLGAVSRAQPAPGLAHRQRSLSVTGLPAESVPEVRGAQGVGITFHFDGPILEESIKVDEERVRVVDVGKRSLLVEPLTTPRTDPPTQVSVRYADGEPRSATFAIVPHPSEVDTWVEVTRPTQPPGEACQARLDALRSRCDARSSTAFRRSGLLTAQGIQVRTFDRQGTSKGGLVAERGVSFLGQTWALVEVVLRNRTGKPRAPRVTALKGQDGQPVLVRSVTAEPEELAPGQEGTLWIEAEVPPASAGEEFTLEVSGPGSHASLEVFTVELPPRTREGKR